MKFTISECERRRKIQMDFNKKRGITPKSIEKAIQEEISHLAEAEDLVMNAVGQNEEQYEFSNMIADLERQMEAAARNLEFEKAAKIRDRIVELKDLGGPERIPDAGVKIKKSKRVQF